MLVIPTLIPSNSRGLEFRHPWSAVQSNMESINALLIRQGLDAPERLRQLNDVAITQMKSLMSASVKRALVRSGRKAGS
jgi:hypothetical protein